MTRLRVAIAALPQDHVSPPARPMVADDNRQPRQADLRHAVVTVTLLLQHDERATATASADERALHLNQDLRKGISIQVDPVVPIIVAVLLLQSKEPRHCLLE